MFDFSAISYNSENPTFLAILFTILCSFILSGIIAFTYEKTSRQVGRPDNFIQAVVLISIVAAMVMQAIGDSVARGLGMLGALAIIRFRTTLRNPRNIVFIFASLAAGLACGVFGFTIAFTGTIGFCVVAFILRFTSFSQKESLIGTLHFVMPQDSDDFKAVQKVLKRYCKNHALKKYRVFSGKKKKNYVEYEYTLKIKKDLEGWNLANELKALPDIMEVRLNFVQTSPVI